MFSDNKQFRNILAFVMICTGIFFLGVWKGMMLKRSIALWKTENNRCWCCLNASFESGSAKKIQPSRKRKRWLKYKRKKKKSTFWLDDHGHHFLFFCFCWGSLLLPCYGKIFWLSCDVTVAKETAAILYQRNHPLVGWLLNSCANIFVCGFGQRRRHFYSSWILKDYVLVRGHTCLGFPPAL